MPNSVCGSKAREKGTKYGKLSQSGKKSRSGGETLTPRQQCIIDKWGFINSQRVRVARRQSTMKFDKKKPLPSVSTEEVVDPLEGTSGSTPSTSQQHNRTSRTTASFIAGFTPNATVVEEGEASCPELIKARMQQATEAREAMTQPQTSHERAIDIFQGFLKTELLKIPENMWFKYTMAAMTMAHNFSQPSQQQMGHMVQPQMGPPPQQMPLMGPPHQQAHQPQSVMGPPQTPPPVMLCSPMATSPTGRPPRPTHSSSTHRNSSGSLHQQHHNSR